MYHRPVSRLLGRELSNEQLVMIAGGGSELPCQSKTITGTVSTKCDIHGCGEATGDDTRTSGDCH